MFNYVVTFVRIIVIFRYVFRDSLSVVRAIEIRRISFKKKANDSQREDKTGRTRVDCHGHSPRFLDENDERMFVSSSPSYKRVGIERVVLPRRLQIKQRRGDNWHGQSNLNESLNDLAS